MESLGLYPVTYLLIAANVILSFMAFSNGALLDKTIMWPYRVSRERQYYRFITSGFIHGDYVHLFFNMFTLYFFGRVIEVAFKEHELGGVPAYLLLYFTALIISDLPTYRKHKDNYGYRCLGASGAVSALVFAAIIFNPWGKIYLFGALAMPSIMYAVLYIVYCVYMSKRNMDNVNHDAHLWGSLYGLALTLVLVAVKSPKLFEYIIYELTHPHF